MPTPQAGESRDDFVQRCIPIVIEDGTAEDGAQATAVCNSMWEQEKNKVETMFLIDEYVSVEPGEPFRLFPFGKLIKGGKERVITPEIASKFKLPHFRPPIKLGGHRDETGAGGHIVGLEVRDDGLYALPEVTPKGAKAISEGDYRYQSPEVIWGEDEGFEDPTTGELIHGPLIVGAALLHMPHLGEAAALYSVEPTSKERNMSDTLEVPMSFWEKLEARFFSEGEGEEPPREPDNDPQAEELEATIQERDEYKTRIEELEAAQAEREREQRVEEFGAQLEEYGVDAEGAETLAAMTEEQSEWVLTQFKALHAQIDESNLLGELGSEGDGVDADNPAKVLNALVNARMKEAEIDYNAALQQVRTEQPELAAQVMK